MRDFLNSILYFIGSESMSDEEFSTVLSTYEVYDQSTYDDLLRIVNVRGSVSNEAERLSGYFTARGANFTPANIGRTNIFMGCPL